MAPPLLRLRALTEVFLTAAAAESPAWALPPETAALCARAAMLHDVGKLAVPDAVLKKPGRLTPAERAVMQRHPLDGCRLLEALPVLAASPYGPYCRDICRWHHERWDGSGYPDGLRGEATPPWARAAALADVYDALVTRRVYRPALSHEQAREMILLGRCGAFDPLLLRVLRDAAPLLPALYGDEESSTAS